jgi:hypothetical protein
LMSTSLKRRVILFSLMQYLIFLVSFSVV